MLKATRSFFEERGVMEVDTHVLSTTAPVDAYIDVMEVDMGFNQTGYLHTSPEYGMKKLLSGGSGDIYQLGHVFRKEESGPWHTPEFTMLEWYRVGMDLEPFIEETLDLIRLFLPDLEAQTLTYHEACKKYAKVDIEKDDFAPLIETYNKEAKDWDRDTQLSLLYSHLVEPQLGKNILTVITNFPGSQAALAKKALVNNIEIARRFEVYFNGIELANGFDELTDAVEQRARLEAENKKRVALGKKALPIDEEFLEALETFPECCGVAVGFDRLVKLTSNLEQWESAGQH